MRLVRVDPTATMGDQHAPAIFCFLDFFAGDIEGDPVCTILLAPARTAPLTLARTRFPFALRVISSRAHRQSVPGQLSNT